VTKTYFLTKRASVLQNIYVLSLQQRSKIRVFQCQAGP